MLRAIVAEEIRKQLPNVLSEMYLKKIVTENTSKVQNSQVPKKKTFEDIFEAELEKNNKVSFGEDDDEIPEPQEPSNRGIYNDKFENTNPTLKKLLDPSNPFAAIYEGTIRSQQQEQAVEVQHNKPQQEQVKKWSHIMNALSNNSKMDKSPEARMRELEMQRKALDEKKVY